MSDPIQSVMQAAERLRRYIHAPSDVSPEAVFREVYGGGTSDAAALARYQTDVADFLGAILPKGQRPVAIEDGDGFAVWIDQMGCLDIGPARVRDGVGESQMFEDGEWLPLDSGVPVVGSVDDAIIEGHHQRFEEYQQRLWHLSSEVFRDYLTSLR